MNLAIVLALILAPALSPLSADETTSRPAVTSPPLELDQHFQGYEGCFVIHNLKTGETRRYNPVRCAKRFSPCSTFKIPNALIGLETGVLNDAEHTYKWDGTKHHRKECNRDQTLRTAIRHSVLWYFQRVADAVGEKRMQEWLDAADYGNKDISGGMDRFWIASSLEISADEQIAFLKKLHDETLPLSERSQKLVKEILIVESDSDVVLRGKTGTRGSDDGDRTILGWFVGTLDTPDADYVFACNITAHEKASGPRARELTKRILKSLDLLPAKANGPHLKKSKDASE